jgi:hypothetical protein
MWSVADGGVVEHFLWVIWVGAVRTKNKASGEAFYPPLRLFLVESQRSCLVRRIPCPVIVDGILEIA